MNVQKRFQINSHKTQDTDRPLRPYDFDALDWIAACFVISTPLFIAYLLLGY